MKSLLLCLLLPACAHTDLYDAHTGKRIAHFEGDMKGLVYQQGKNGEVTLTGTINHSAATIAQGKSAAGAITATAAFAILAP